MADGKVVIDIVADASSALTSLDGFSSRAQKVTSAVGSAASAAAKATAAAVAAIGTGLVTLGKQATEAYASYEQLTGGVETLFKDSAAKVEAYADEAYTTAGMSANDYMETVTSFSASLISSLGGDTEAAAEYANRAITDMADNANKMGTDMESIQNAYQGQRKALTYLSSSSLGLAA